MEIEVKPNFDGKVEKLIINHEEKTYVVDVQVITVTNFSNEKNIGNILETYRKKKIQESENNATTYFELNKEKIDAFISNVHNPFIDYAPELVFVFFPTDQNRFDFTSNFTDTLSIPDFNNINYSDRFKKSNPNQSITNGLTTDDFEFDSSNIKPAQRILLIDDTIDKGRTVGILISKLIESKLITDETEVKLICAYNNAKAAPKVNYKDFMTKK
jgi:predicted amidophosphoribosyltransferase